MRGKKTIRPEEVENHFADMLRGGDRRSIGRADEAATLVLAAPERFGALFGVLSDPDPVIAMRAADAVEKVTRTRPDLLVPYKHRILIETAAIGQKEVRWHTAMLIPRLPLNGDERRQAVEILFRFLEDDSRIVKTEAMQALAELAQQDAELVPKILPVIRRLTETGSPAMKSRGRKLLSRLEKG